MVKRIIRGLGYSEKYGHHPGTPILIILVVGGLIAQGLIGAGIMLAVFLPVYLIGAYERGK